MTEHPGKIRFEDAARGTVQERPAAAVPREVAFVLEDGAWTPVTRVLAEVHGEERTISQFSEDGRLLLRTRQRMKRTA